MWHNEKYQNLCSTWKIFQRIIINLKVQYILVVINLASMYIVQKHTVDTVFKIGWCNDVISISILKEQINMAINYLTTSIPLLLIFYIRDRMSTNPSNGINWGPCLKCRPAVNKCQTSATRIIDEAFPKQTIFWPFFSNWIQTCFRHLAAKNVLLDGYLLL